MNLNEPSPEQYGLTKTQVEVFDKATKSKSSIIAISIIINIICISIFDATVLRIESFLLLLFFGTFPGYLVGKFLDEKRMNSIRKQKGYNDYLKYTDAVKNYHALLKRLRWAEIKKRNAVQEEIRKKEEWWRGIDGHRFELEVAKLLMNKHYDVKHTGSAGGDGGVDLTLKMDNKNIIIQCKAFKNYVSAGYVRELYGTLIHQKADEAWLVVTSGFYSGARQFANDKSIRLLTIKDLIRLPLYKYTPTTTDLPPKK